MSRSSLWRTASSPCGASTQKRMRRPEPVRRAARAAAPRGLLDRRLPDLRTEATALDCLPARAAVTMPNGVLLGVPLRALSCCAPKRHCPVPDILPPGRPATLQCARCVWSCVGTHACSAASLASSLLPPANGERSITSDLAGVNAGRSAGRSGSPERRGGRHVDSLCGRGILATQWRPWGIR